tara:strand:- start:12985 stop:13719 length:735 start_codon:yes stop_codon:yes gene_type:complete
MNSMAKNHLSTSSQLGRLGDNKIRFVDGELSHVNTTESNLIDSLGKTGEDIVKNIGSGTINPNTGMKEYWLPIAAAVAGVALGAIGSYSSGRSSSQQASAQAAIARQGLKDIKEAEKNLEGVLFSKENIAKQEYQKEIQNLSTGTGYKLKDLRASSEQAMKKTGFANSGTVKEQSEQMLGRVKDSYSMSSDDLMANLGQKMGEITSFYEGEKARLKSEKFKLSKQADLYDQQSDNWYLGKNLFG